MLMPVNKPVRQDFVGVRTPRRTSLTAGLRVALFGALLAGLAACADPLSRACPQAGVLGDAGRIELMRADGDADSPRSVIATGMIERINSDCRYTDNEARIEVEAVISAERGPGAERDQAEFDYFVTILTPGDDIAAKRVFTVSVPFDNGRGRVRESLTQTIPISGPFGSAAGYRIIVGFQLTPEQLERNRGGESAAGSDL